MNEPSNEQLVPIALKAVERIIQNARLRYLEWKISFVCNQYDFIKGRFCFSGLLCFQDEKIRMKNRGLGGGFPLSI